MRSRELCSSPSGLPRALVVTEVPEEGDNFFSKASFGAVLLAMYLKENHPLASSIVAHDILLIAIVRLLMKHPQLKTVSPTLRTRCCAVIASQPGEILVPLFAQL
eukprot:s66_g20.t1